MTIRLRQSTASQEIPLGYFVDSTDGDTEVTGLTIANTDIKIWKAGATTLANKNSGGATHISNGIYYAVLDATDTDTVGPLVVFCHVSGALTVRLECEVLEEAVYDALFAASAAGYQVPIWAAANSTVNLSDTTIKTATDVETDTADIQTRLGTPSNLGGGASLAANLVNMAGATFDTSTDALESIRNRGDSAWITATGFSTLDAAGVRSAVGLGSANLDTQFAALPTAAENADAVWEEDITDHSGTASSTAEALAAAGGAGDPWITALPGSYSSGQAGYIIGTFLDAAISSRLAASSTGSGLSEIPWNAAWDPEVQSEVDDALVALNLDHLVKSAVDTDFATTVHLNSVVGYLADNGSSATFNRTTDSLEALATSDAAILAAISAPSEGGGSSGIGNAASSLYTSQRLTFDPLHIGEIKQLEFPFSGALLLGETISSATITVSVYSGTDSNPSALKSGSLTISGTSVLQNFTGSGGELGVVYNLLCTATTSAGRQLQARGFLALVPQS